MLTKLSVENYALIDKLDIEFSSSLNIITGETGAGKSILLGALGLILGNRADTTALKDNEKNCIVEGIFNIAGYNLQEFFEEEDLEYDDSAIIRRVITPAGKSRTYINDLPVQLATLKNLSSRLLDIHSQHQSQMIADEAFRMRIVDGIAGNKDIILKYRDAFSALRAAEAELAKTKYAAEENRKDEEYIRFQYDQLAAMRLQEGELALLEAEQKELANAEQIQVTLADCVGLLDNDETGILPTIKSAISQIKNIAGVYPQGASYIERLQSVFVELKDANSELASEAERIEHNPQRLAEVDERLNSIYSLLQKHHTGTVEELIALEKEFAARLDNISNSDEAIAALEAKVEELYTQANSLAAKLTETRKKAAASLSKGVEAMLERLGMPASRFICDISPKEMVPTGADEIKFLFTSNKNNTPQALEKIASGGEVSRVMLSIKSIVAKSTMLPTIIFDEIDTGISGRIADVTGEIITELSHSMQVINITHLPQVASKGDTHFVVFKEMADGASKTRIRLLTREERIVEIAKMLSGSTVTDAAMAQASALLGL